LTDVLIVVDNENAAHGGPVQSYFA
jgi:hypothetical protein